MISLDLAPNEDRQDALKSITILAQPWIWIKGQYSGRVKTKLKRFFPQHDAFLYMSARGALYKVLQSMKLKAGDEVVVIGFTCEAVVLPIVELKLTPLFVDVETKSFSLDLEDLKRKLTGKTKVIILQHSFGITPVHRVEILELAKSSHLQVIEDLAHGFDNRMFMADDADSIKILSFGRSKAISSVFGGAALTKDKKLQEILKQCDKRLITPRTSFVARCLLYKPFSIVIKSTYDFAMFGKTLHWLLNAFYVIPRELTDSEKHGQFNPQMAALLPNAFAFLLNYQLKNFEQLQEIRRKNVAAYNDAFHSVQTDTPLSRYPVLIAERDELMKKLRKQQIYLGRWYHKLVSPEGVCPVADSIKDSVLNLPTQVSAKKRALVMKQVELHAFHQQA